MIVLKGFKNIFIDSYCWLLCIVVVKLRTHNPLVVGSSPTGPTKLKPLQPLACKGFLFLKF